MAAAVAIAFALSLLITAIGLASQGEPCRVTVVAPTEITNQPEADVEARAIPSVPLSWLQAARLDIENIEQARQTEDPPHRFWRVDEAHLVAGRLPVVVEREKRRNARRAKERDTGEVEHERTIIARQLVTRGVKQCVYSGQTNVTGHAQRETAKAHIRAESQLCSLVALHATTVAVRFDVRAAKVVAMKVVDRGRPAVAGSANIGRTDEFGSNRRGQ